MSKSWLASTILSIGVLFQGGSLAAQSALSTSNAKPELASQKEKLSYAIGMKVGRGLRGDSIEIDPNALLQGLKDAMSGAPTQLTEEEGKALLEGVTAELAAKQQAEVHRLSDANKEEGKRFLAANKSKEGVTTLPSGLQYKILKEGSGPKPSASDTVVCNFRGTLLNGTEFDNTQVRGKPATLKVNQVIAGWKEALQLMPVGSKWQLFVPADLAYGERSPLPSVGPNSTLIFEMELLAIKGADEATGPRTTSK